MLPRLAQKPLLWLVALTFVAGAVLSRYGWISEAMREDVGEMNGSAGSTTVTFMVIFYVGYWCAHCRV